MLKASMGKDRGKELYMLVIRLALRLIWSASVGLWPSILNLLSWEKCGAPTRLKSDGVVILHDCDNYAGIARYVSENLDYGFLQCNIEEMKRNTGVHNHFVRDLAPNLSESVKLKLIDFSLSTSNLGLAASYLGFLPKLASIKVLLNVPSPNRKRGSQLWHRDGMVHLGLNLFIAVTDINERNGEYSAVSFQHIKRHQVLIGPDKNVGWDQDRITEEQMDKYLGDAGYVSLVGGPGTAAIVDNGWIYHKGGYLEEGHRIMLEVSYQSTSRHKDAGVGSICSVWGLDEEKVGRDLGLNYFNTYSLRGGRPVNLISHFLYKLYRRFTRKQWVI